MQNYADSIVRAGQFEWLLEKINRFSPDEKMKFYKLYYFEGNVIAIVLIMKRQSRPMKYVRALRRVQMMSSL